jgi:phytoene dehydrogenase-like protein
MHVAVLGSGLSGLTSAALLAKRAIEAEIEARVV